MSDSEVGGKIGGVVGDDGDDREEEGQSSLWSSHDEPVGDNMSKEIGHVTPSHDDEYNSLCIQSLMVRF
jgi:hypothetical protein